MPITHLEIGNNKIAYGTAAPRLSRGEKGDIVFNLDISNGILAWLCTETGTPGEWAEIPTATQIAAKTSGTTLTDQLASINFTGAGVSTVTEGNDVTVTIPGGGGGEGGAESYVVNVKDWGAVGDGVTNDTTAINAAKAQLTAANGVLFFPPGTYLITGSGILVTYPSGTTLRGAGQNLTTIKVGSSISNYMMQNGGTYRERITFEDITFDGNNLTAGVLVASGSTTNHITFRRCRVINSNRILVAQGITGLTIEDCWFHGGFVKGRPGISFTNGAQNVNIRNSKFLLWDTAISISTGDTLNPDEQLVENMVVEGCYFDGGWWAYPSRKSNSGGTVTYNATQVMDSAGGFTAAAPASSDTVRVLVSHRTSSTTNCTQTQLTDSGAAFTTYGIMRGEIIRSGSKYTYVTGVDSDTILCTEGWLDSTTHFPTSPPAIGAAYTVYKVIIGQIFDPLDSSDTQITVIRWYRMNGEEVYSIPDGSLYELASHLNYSGFHAEYGIQNCRITHNTFKRSWSDQVSYFGNRGIISHNVIMDGQDVGVTVNGAITDGHTQVCNNLIIRQGAIGVWIGSSKDNTVSHNQILRSCWTSTLGYSLGGGVCVQGSSKNLVESNLIDGENQPQSYFGITLSGIGGQDPCDYNIVRNNVIRNILIDEWEPNTEYALQDRVRMLNGNRVYRCVQAGTSGSGSGPSGWTSNEADGEVEWHYLGSNAEIMLTGNKGGCIGNEIYGNTMTRPTFHYSSTVPYDSSTWVDGGFYHTLSGSGSPEGVVTAALGTMYQRTDIGQLWIKTTGVLATGWTQIT